MATYRLKPLVWDTSVVGWEAISETTGDRYSIVQMTGVRSIKHNFTLWHYSKGWNKQTDKWGTFGGPAEHKLFFASEAEAKAWCGADYTSKMLKSLELVRESRVSVDPYGGVMFDND